MLVASCEGKMLNETKVVPVKFLILCHLQISWLLFFTMYPIPLIVPGVDLGIYKKQNQKQLDFYFIIYECYF